MHCCDIMNRAFDEKQADKDIRKYEKKGLSKEAKGLYDFLKPRVHGLSVLDVGCGIGSLVMELVKAGATKSLGVDVSQAYITGARALREKNGINSLEFKIIDFIEQEKELENKDIVISDKVVCCVPDLESFVKATASHARSWYGIIYPRRNIISRFVVRIVNFFIQFTKKKGFHFYLHPVKEMNSLIENQGFKRVSKENTIIWEIAVFERG